MKSISNLSDSFYEDYFNSEKYKIHEKIESFYWNIDNYIQVSLIPDINLGFTIRKWGRCFWIKPEDVKDKKGAELESFLLECYREFLGDFQDKVKQALVDIEKRLGMK